MNSSQDWAIGPLIVAAIRRYADEPMLVSAGRTSTYRDGGQVVEDVAARIRETGARGCAAVLAPNCADYVIALLAIGVAQWTRTALNVVDSTENNLLKLRMTRAAVLVTTPGLLDGLGGLAVLERFTDVALVLLMTPGTHAAFEARKVQPSPELDAEWVREIGRVHQLGFTGGTTGRPKAVTLAPRHIRSLTTHLWTEVTLPSPGDIFHALTPYSHASGTFVLPFILRGAALSGEERADVARMSEEIDDGYLSGYRVTTFTVPTVLARLVAHVERDGPWDRDPRDWFETIVYGAAPTPAALALRAGELFGPHLVQIYAQAEVPMVVATMQPDDLHRHGTRTGACVGRAAALVEVWIERPDGTRAGPGEVGEVYARADHVMSGYWRNEDETAGKLDGRAVGTNDLGYLDEDGLLWIVGRNRDMIISGGFNVYPSQVEEKLRSAPVVQDVLVVGAPDARWGEAVVAGVVLDNTCDRSEALAQLEDLARDRLAAYERPKRYLVLDALPTTALGKPDRNALLGLVASDPGAAT